MIYIDVASVIIAVLVGLGVGYLVNSLSGNRNDSLLRNLLLGLAGAFVGGLLLPALGIYFYGFLGKVVTAVIGAFIIILVARLFAGNRRVRF